MTSPNPTGQPLAVVSLFAGVGGIDRAAQQAGLETRLLCEIDKPCRTVLAERFPGAVIHDDVRTLTADDIAASGAVPERTVLTAGFPCQDVSVAGRRKGMGEGTRTGLYWHVDRLLAEFRPAWVLLENVPGLLSAVCICPGDGSCIDNDRRVDANGCGEWRRVKEGRIIVRRWFASVEHSVPKGACRGGCVTVHGGVMGAVLGSLGERGYGFAYRVLDAQHFGVPQRRRRVVIVGHLGDTGAASAEILFEPEGSGRDHPPLREAGEGVAGTLGGGSGSRGWAPDTDRMTFVPIAFHMTQDPISGPISPAMGTGNSQGCSTIAVAFSENQRGELVTKDTMDSLKTGGGKPGQGYPAVLSVALRGREGGSTAELGDDQANALRASQGGGDKAHILNETAVRRLTPMECERLQGFPDDWTLIDGTSDSQRYKQMGNSVAVPVFAWVMRRLAAVDAALADRRVA